MPEFTNTVVKGGMKMLTRSGRLDRRMTQLALTVFLWRKGGRLGRELGRTWAGRARRKLWRLEKCQVWLLFNENLTTHGRRVRKRTRRAVDWTL